MYSVIDIETTSPKPKDGRMVEIAIVNLDQYRQQDGPPFETFLSIPFSMHSPQAIKAQKVNGICDIHLQGAPKFEDVSQQIVEMTQGRTIVAHNVDFELKWLKYEFGLIGRGFERLTYCTLKHAKRLFPHMEKYNLDHLSQAFITEARPNHRALQDALTTLEIFRSLMERDEWING